LAALKEVELAVRVQVGRHERDGPGRVEDLVRVLREAPGEIWKKAVIPPSSRFLEAMSLSASPFRSATTSARMPQVAQHDVPAGNGPALERGARLEEERHRAVVATRHRQVEPAVPASGATR